MITRDQLEKRLVSLRQQQATIRQEVHEREQRLVLLEGQATEAEFWLFEIAKEEAAEAAEAAELKIVPSTG